MDCAEMIPVWVGMLAAGIAQECSTDALNLLAVVFSQLGDSLAVIAAARPPEEA